jgi:exodeoxyribonuclease V alpha subunit
MSSSMFLTSFGCCVQSITRQEDADWYPGRPVMVLRNDYSTRLFNGDIGITLAGGDDGALQVYFPGEGGDGYRSVPLARLPELDTAFAMTVHKSQGSEFQQIALVLPAVSTRVVTRELLYTAVTRARSEVLLVSPESVLKEGISKQTSRRSGLLARLQESQT